MSEFTKMVLIVLVLALATIASVLIAVVHS
jgi:hypothetical protein